MDKDILKVAKLKEQAEEDREVTMPEYLKFIVNPDLKKKVGVFFTKELKVSNIKRDDIQDVAERTDLAWQTWLMAGQHLPFEKTFAFFLLMDRDVRLSASSSVDATERTLQITSKIIGEFAKKKAGMLNFFKRGDED